MGQSSQGQDGARKFTVRSTQTARREALPSPTTTTTTTHFPALSAFSCSSSGPATLPWCCPSPYPTSDHAHVGLTQLVCASGSYNIDHSPLCVRARATGFSANIYTTKVVTPEDVGIASDGHQTQGQTQD